MKVGLPLHSIFLPASGPGIIEYISSTFMSIAAFGVSLVIAFSPLSNSVKVFT